MCGRYALYNTSEIERRFTTRPPPFTLRDSYNVAPGQFLPVIVQTKKAREIASMKWGLVPAWAKEPSIGYKMINARAEGIFSKPAWRGPIRRRRCLVPATGFYEWKHVDGERTKQPFFIHPQDQNLFAFAGVFDVWHDAAGRELYSYAIVTTNANADMAAVHDRMPVILHATDWEVWLDPAVQDPEVLEELLRPYPNNLAMYPVSSNVNVAKNNDRYLVYPVSSH